MNNKIALISFIALVSIVLAFGVVSSKPTGATPTYGTNETFDAESPGQHNAIAGNVTEVNLYALSVTQTWQGYYGNVSGAIILANNAGDQMYNWSSTTPNAEVYASTNNSLLWTSMACYNLANVATLESAFSIPENATDGVDETFNRTDHTTFTTNGQELSSCPSVKLFNDAGTPTYDVALITDAVNNTIFTSIITNDATGFDGNSRQFQMIVLEDGRSDTTATPYYFYLQLS